MEGRGQADHSVQLVSFTSCLFFFGIYRYLGPVISARVSSGYGKLRPSEQIDWNSRVFSIAHAVIVCSVALYLLLHSGDIADDLMWGRSTLARVNCGITVGYMITDTFIMIWHLSEVGSAVFLLHHVGTLYAFYYISTYGVFLWLASLRILSEIGAAFVHMIWFLTTVNCPKNKPIFIVTAVFTFLTYILTRLLLIPFHWYYLSQVIAQSLQYFGNITYLFCLVCLIIDVLNIYWFTKIVRGALIVIRKDRKCHTYEEEKKLF